MKDSTQQGVSLQTKKEEKEGVTDKNDFEYLIVPVNLPSQDHWPLVVISVIAMCIHIYNSYEQTQEKTLRTIFDTIKDGFLSKERQFVKDKKKEM